MKHEYAMTISRSDRLWLIFFVTALLGWELIKPLLPRQMHHQLQTGNYFPMTTGDSLQSSSVSMQQLGDTDDASTINDSLTEMVKGKSVIKKDTINIMQATWAQLKSLGFTSKTASNITKYIAAGGILKDEVALMKIYGMDSVQLESALPYLRFPTLENKIPRESSEVKKDLTQGPLIDLNTATIADLESLPGIGNVLAERIISYRQSLGGFIDAHQIKEVFGMSPETIEKISPRLTVIHPHTTVSVNHIDLSTFRHPYLPKKYSRILSAYLHQHGTITNRGDLIKVYPPDTTWCQKLIPYLTFD